MTKRLVLRIEEDGTPAAYIALLTEGAVVVPPPEDPEPPPVVIPPAGAGWVVVTSELAWTFKDNRTVVPTLGVGGTYRVEANFDIPGTVLLHGEAHFGPGAIFPMPGNPWWFLPLTARMKPCRRGVGALRIYHNNKGPLTAGEVTIQYNAGANPPYYYFTLIHNPKLESDGFLDSDYPPGCWSTDGSYWLFDITYRTA
jgi:hypothetical protein